MRRSGPGESPMLNICPSSDAGEPHWVDLFNPTPEEISEVERRWHVKVPTRAQLEEIESSSRLSVQDGTLHLNMPVVAHQGEEAPTALGFVLNKDLFVTVRFTHLYGFDTAIQHFKKEGEAKSSSEVFATLIEGITDYAADALEQISKDLNDT